MPRWNQGGRRAVSEDKALFSVFLVSGPMGPGTGSGRLCAWRSLWEKRVAGRQVGGAGSVEAPREPQGEGGGGTSVQPRGGWELPYPEKAPSCLPWAPLAFRAHDHPRGQIQKDHLCGEQVLVRWWGALLEHLQVTLCPSSHIPDRPGPRLDRLGWPHAILKPHILQGGRAATAPRL